MGVCRADVRDSSHAAANFTLSVSRAEQPKEEKEEAEVA